MGSSPPGRRIAAIDVGTNTIRMLVARLHDGVPSALASASSMTGLGAGLGETGRITAEALDAAERTLTAMVGEARGPEGVAAERVEDHALVVVAEPTHERRADKACAPREEHPLTVDHDRGGDHTPS